MLAAPIKTMPTNRVIQEMTQLNPGDCFTVSTMLVKELEVPLHYHDEYELTLVLNGKGVKRVAGNSIGVLDDAELLFIGPNLYHAWFTHQCVSAAITMVSIRFDKDLFGESLLMKNQFSRVRSLLMGASRGALFPPETVTQIADRIINLKQKTHLEAVIELFAIFDFLSTCQGTRLLSDPGFSEAQVLCKSRRIERVFDLMHNHFHRHIALSEAAEIANMPSTSFSRFFKVRTGKTFIAALNEIRVGRATRMLVDTQMGIAQVAYKCGFNNISNFNRVFKLKKQCTPHEFRETFAAGRTHFI